MEICHFSRGYFLFSTWAVSYTHLEDLPEDTIKQTENDAQKLHDKYIGRVEEALSAKEKEIMTI